MAYHAYSTPQNSEETRGNAITQPWSHPIKEKKKKKKKKKKIWLSGDFLIQYSRNGF